MLNTGEQLDDIPDFLQIAHDHSYIEGPINDFALKYVVGFTARRWRKSQCDQCIKTLVKNSADADETDLLITLKSKVLLDISVRCCHFPNVLLGTYHHGSCHELW